MYDHRVSCSVKTLMYGSCFIYNIKEIWTLHMRRKSNEYAIYMIVDMHIRRECALLSLPI